MYYFISCFLKTLTVYHYTISTNIHLSKSEYTTSTSFSSQPYHMDIQGGFWFFFLGVFFFFLVFILKNCSE